MQNVGMTLMLGMGQALAAGIGGMSNTGDGLKQMNQGAGSYSYSNTPGVTPSYTPTAPAMPSMGVGSQFYQMYGSGGF